MIVVLNGYPGVGKLTVGQALAPLLGGRLLDIHTIYNVAFALTDFKSPEFRETVQKIEAIADELVLKLPAGEPVVLTTVLAGDGEWGDAEWLRIRRLGEARPPLCVVHLSCELEENVRRVESEERRFKRKPRDSEMVRRNHAESKRLYGFDEEHLLELDATDLASDAAAAAIAEWVRSI